MPKKNNIPYEDKKSTKKTRAKKTLEATTRIRIDKERLDDTDSLDTSFLEGREEVKKKREKKTRKNKKKFNFKKLFITIIIILIIVGVVLFAIYFKPSKTPVIKSKTEIVKVVDNNYLFVGDFNTNNLDLGGKKYYVKVAEEDLTTTKVTADINNYICVYNPSKVFIQLGINDLVEGKNEAEILTNLSEIIDGVKKDRKYAEIYLESIYPINKELEDFNSDKFNDINNEKIKELNSMLKDLAKDKKVKYLDIYKELVKDNNLNPKYTDDGIYLNARGIKKVFPILKKSVDAKNEKVK